MFDIKSWTGRQFHGRGDDGSPIQSKDPMLRGPEIISIRGEGNHT